ncbi:MAG: GNAT family N-acetyltransferase [Lentilactobacillus hilgardii]|uniref:GNAT family N-acetyltransferase n=1 Tax=Lentilactobacillus hilgardii TaxID=1588 RepID=UPI001CC1F61F|nr:GNAT family N-acetyltransferase [Lentilactobacillus hilgardii]MBZ2199765.1 hypothetical protein [Lentilactobacillus hilgardii]MBZ2203741.1 hypothetical protein [Lentilactobacillus hilgardii]
MPLTLVPLSCNDSSLAFYNVLQEITANDNGFHNSVYQKSFTLFKDWLQRASLDALGIQLPKGYVPQTTYWLMENYHPIGIGRIKHYLTPELVDYTGHLAYAIQKSKRGQGYGDQLCTLLLEKCKDMAINPVQVTAYPTNKLSNNIIKNHGGKLIHQNSQLNIYHIVY